MSFDPDKTYEKEDIASWPPGHRRCRKCQEVLPFEMFHKHAQCLFGINTVCKPCRKPGSKANYQNQSIAYRLHNSAKGRAKKHGIPFDLSVEDIDIPEMCPVLGEPLVPNTLYAASIDQIEPRGGYTKDNIRIISLRANILKNNATVEEMEAVLAYLRGEL